MEKRIFRHSVRVPYAHVDQMGFVYYANYFVYFEMARAELLREAGMPYTDMEKRGVMLPVVTANCEYKKPAHFDDLLNIETRCTAINGTRLRIEYVITRGDNVIVTGYTEHICMSSEGKVLRPVPELKKLIHGTDI
ncbi:MAG: thioesterase family protein [Kiritimatiellae bacterium]|nr:thioesterase family protein [Kiritimatiellia bacterium]MDD5520911.1 thioesterase family protein [Kiritimatiellia bacterium]